MSPRPAVHRVWLRLRLRLRLSHRTRPVARRLFIAFILLKETIEQTKDSAVVAKRGGMPVIPSTFSTSSATATGDADVRSAKRYHAGSADRAPGSDDGESSSSSTDSVGTPSSDNQNRFQKKRVDEPCAKVRLKALAIRTCCSPSLCVPRASLESSPQTACAVHGGPSRFLWGYSGVVNCLPATALSVTRSRGAMRVMRS